MLSRIPTSCASSALLLLVVSVTDAHASSTQAWEAFRHSVESACVEAGAPHLDAPSVVVDPFGSQSYGLALLSGISREDGAPQSLICVYDKATGAVEVGGVLALERALPAQTGGSNAPAPTVPSRGEAVTQRLLSTAPLAPAGAIVASPSANRPIPGAVASTATLCDGPCPAWLDRLTQEDRDGLIGLPAQIERTVEAGEGATIGGAEGAAREAAASAARAAGGEPAPLQPVEADLSGAASCTLFYFGFSGEAARTVGTHQCRFSQGTDGALLVEKTSGERLRARVEPLREGVAGFLGRSFEAGAERQDYDPAVPQDDASSELGNVVGFVAGTQDAVYLVSSQRRRFDPSDSFFWVLAVDRP